MTDITLPTKVRIVKGMVFPVVTYRCELHHEEDWPQKNWCLYIVMLESLLDSKEINTVHPKGNKPEYSLEGLMLKLKLLYFGHLMRRADSLEKTLLLGKIEGRRRRGQQRWDGWLPLLTQWTWVWANSRSWWWTGRPGVLRFMGSQRVGHDWATELNWTDEI